MTEPRLDAIELEVYRHRLSAIAEEMGELLTRTGFSPNIKERRDHSCALFDAAGDMIAQAAHIPVHLGAAPLCVQAVISRLDVPPGATAIVNDPFAGGTHLPDITLVTPVDPAPGVRFWVATRAHHADVGGIAPGSLPIADHIDDEGWRVEPCLLGPEVEASLLAASRTPDERRGDLAAQRAANERGARRLLELCAREGTDAVVAATRGLLSWSERATERLLTTLPTTRVRVEDTLDGARGEAGEPEIPIVLTMSVEPGRLVLDFGDSADSVHGPMNAVRPIVESAVLYVLLCLLGDGVPANSGILRAVEIRTRPGSVVDARWPSAVSAGNVETSQRLVDVVLQAFASLLPAEVPAASQGTMNNVLLGGRGADGRPWVVYETIGGGAGGGPAGPGASALQVHMTNTLNTPIEALEHAFPLEIVRYAVREGSGGAGRHRGGDGIVRAFRLLDGAELTLIGERRRRGPPGRAGGADGAAGVHRLVTPDGREEVLPAKVTRQVEAGSVIVVETPGGGGWGASAGDQRSGGTP